MDAHAAANALNKNQDATETRPTVNEPHATIRDNTKNTSEEKAAEQASKQAAGKLVNYDSDRDDGDFNPDDPLSKDEVELSSSSSSEYEWEGLDAAAEEKLEIQEAERDRTRLEAQLLVSYDANADVLKQVITMKDELLEYKKTVRLSMEAMHTEFQGDYLNIIIESKRSVHQMQCMSSANNKTLAKSIEFKKQITKLGSTVGELQETLRASRELAEDRMIQMTRLQDDMQSADEAHHDQLSLLANAIEASRVDKIETTKTYTARILQLVAERTLLQKQLGEQEEEEDHQQRHAAVLLTLQEQIEALTREKEERSLHLQIMESTKKFTENAQVEMQHDLFLQDFNIQREFSRVSTTLGSICLDPEEDLLYAR